MSNVSFVAQAADWVPGILYDILHLAFLHRGLSFVSILQRCPHYLPGHFDEYIKNPERILLLTHPDGLQADEASARRFKNRDIKRWVASQRWPFVLRSHMIGRAFSVFWPVYLPPLSSGPTRVKIIR